MADLYMRLDHREYKELEKACKEFKETVHATVTGFYHKSFRIPFGDGTLEFHGPSVKASESEVLDVH